MSVPPVLYKFSGACGALAILKSKTLRTTSPLDFNDPFEAFPAYDEERKNYMIDTRRHFYTAIGQPAMASLTAEGNEREIPVENWVGINEKEHDRLFEQIFKQFRVLCLSKSPTANLLWSHYAQSHAGIAIGFNFESSDFPKGQIADGIHVDYQESRHGHLLPREFYRHNGLNAFHKNPDAHFTRDDGTQVTHEEQSEVYVECLKRILSTKHVPWEYEEELRFLYHLAKPDRDGLVQDAGYDIARFTPEMVTDVIFGYRCPPKVIETTAATLEDQFPQVQMHYVDLHPYKYEVRLHRGDAEHILGMQKGRFDHSFRSRIPTP
jgi:hypothetical protein